MLILLWLQKNLKKRHIFALCNCAYTQPEQFCTLGLCLHFAWASTFIFFMVFVCIFQHLVISKHYAVEFNENLWLYLEKGSGTIRLFHMFDVTTMLNIHQLNTKQFSLTAKKKFNVGISLWCHGIQKLHVSGKYHRTNQKNKKSAQNSLTLCWTFEGCNWIYLV